jgi:hypothetical protein
MLGVGPADRTGKSTTRYWPGGSAALGRRRPLNPRDTVLIAHCFRFCSVLPLSLT